LRASEAALVAALLAAIPAAAQAQANAAPVIAAERAFAARAAEVGVAQSFLDFMTDDAIVFAPAPVNARELYSSRPAGKSPKEGGALLAWWPNWAGIARSGDLGFTTGPAEVNGKRSLNYFTVWRKQADGRWRWVYDGGASDASQGRPPEAPVEVLAAGDRRPIPPALAMTQVNAAESVLAAVAASDVPRAFKAVLTPDAHMQGSPLPPAATPQAVDRELAARAPAIAFKTLGGSASDAGDLAWTYGSASWARGGAAGHGHYVRIWQRRPEGWRLVFDQLLDDAPQP
jgi:ketosteroid isomerase-like protein